MQNQQFKNQESKLLLGYWLGAWKAQGIRLLLEYLEIPYEQKLYPESDMNSWFVNEKPLMKNPFPNLPYIIDGNFTLTESTVLYDYIIEKAQRQDLQGKNNDRFVINEIKSLTSDLHHPIYMMMSMEEQEKERKFQEQVKQKIQYLKDFLGSKQWIMGDNLSVADFCTYSLIKQLQVALPQQYSTSFDSQFDKYIERFEKLPSIANYMKSDKYINY